MILSLEHFKSYRAKQEVPLTEQGFVLVQGENRVSAAADSNFVGKTSLFHAVAWGCFGLTLAGERADDVACRFTTDPCVVSLTWPNVGQIVRGRRPARFLVTPQRGNDLEGAEAQAWVEDRLGFGYRTFLHAVVFSQSSIERYAQADQEEQLRMLDEIRGLDLRGSLKRAKDWREQVQAKQQATGEAYRAAMSDLEKCQGILESLRRSRAQWDAGVAQWKQERQHSLGLRQRAWTEALSQERALREQSSTFAETTLAWNTATKTLRTLHQEAIAFDSDLRGLKKSLEEFATLRRQQTCPTCRQALKNLKPLTQYALDLQRLRDDHQRAFILLNHEIDRVSTRVDELDQMLKGLPDASMHAIQAAHERVVDAKRALDEETARPQPSETWPDRTLLLATEKREQQVTDALQQHVTQSMRLDATLTMAAYAIEAFGDYGIRSLLLDHDAHYINARLVEHLEALAGGEARLRLSAQQALKSGKSRERVSLEVEWDEGSATLKGASGGQGKRGDLALFAALQDFAETRAAKPFPFKVLDEPADALDTRGQELFVPWARQQAKQRGSCFLITHSPTLANMVTSVADQVWTVVYERTGAQLVRG